MMTVITATEFSRNFSDYINRVSYRGESFIIKKGTKMVAEIRPTAKGRKLGELIELVEDLPSLSTPEKKSFLEDLNILRSQETNENQDPWES